MKRAFQAGGWTLSLCMAVLTLAASPLPGQQAPAGSESLPVIKAETRLVLVDTVVTDKKGNFIPDLEAKDFRVWEDNKEQKIKSFSAESDESSPPQQHYLVLFFDNSGMGPAEQTRARQAAAKFIDANAAPNRLIAIIDFGGAVRIAQNFTSDGERLKKVVSGIRFGRSRTEEPAEVASIGAPSLSRLETDFGARTVLMALRSVARSLASVPGRKSVAFLTSGFVMNNEAELELAATIDACNKANVAVYPIDVRGLVSGIMGPGMAKARPGPPHYRAAVAHSARGASTLYGARLVLVQRGRAPGDAPQPSQRPPSPPPNPPPNQPPPNRPPPSRPPPNRPPPSRPPPSSPGTRGTVPLSRPLPPPTIVPQFPRVADNQMVLYALAEGTGGFVIVNSNDLAGGLEKIARDQGHYYVLGYTPAQSAEGSCHTLKVKVDRHGSVLRSRSGYCNVRPADALAGKPEGQQLEELAKGPAPGTVSATASLPYFYTGPNTARVNVAMQIPTAGMKFEKVKGKQHAAIDVLGIAYKQNGSVAARFSDRVDLDFDGKKEAEEFTKTPFQYENQFDAATGAYKLTIVFRTAKNTFGKLETPLVIDAYDGKQFALSAPALSGSIRRLSDIATSLDDLLIQDRTALVAYGLQFVPTAKRSFQKTDNAAIYLEVYEPLLLAEAQPPKVGIQIRLFDRKTGQLQDSVMFDKTKPNMQQGNPVIPVAIRVPVNTLPPGAYRMELKAEDSAGHASAVRSVDFEVE